MNTYSLTMQIFDKTQINEIAIAIKSGKAVVLPTDTVWGIASLTDTLIYEIKKRSREKKVIKFVDSVESLRLPSFFVDVIKPYWPGGLSIVWKGICYRMPNCKYILELLKQTGPLFQSSANISGDAPIASPEDVPKVFAESINKIAVVQNSPFEQLSQKPSTIVDLDKLVVIRNGEIDGQEIINKLKRKD